VSTELTGSLLAGRYRLGAAIGAGGMATVYRAHDQDLNREVAIKVLKPALVADATATARFTSEAQTQATLNVPGVPAVHDIGKSQGTPFFVMELLEGQDLKAALQAGEPLKIEEALRVGEAVAEVLQACHAAGLVHRDIKPRNVFLSSDGSVKLLDFGIVRTTPAGELTTTSVVLGTPAYASPEQVRGHRATSSSDLYSLGCMLYEALTAEPPFGSHDPETVARAHISAPPPKPSLLSPWIPPSVDALVLKMMAKDPSHRPPNAAAVRRDIKDVRRSLQGLETQPMLAMSDTLLDTAPVDSTETLVAVIPKKPPTRRGAATAILVVLAMIFVGGAIWVATTAVTHVAGAASPTATPSASKSSAATAAASATPAQVTAPAPSPTTVDGAAAALLGTVQAAQGQGLIDPGTATQITSATSTYLGAVSGGSAHEVRKALGRLTDAVDAALAMLGPTDPLRSTLAAQYWSLAAYAPQPGSQSD